MNLCSSPLIGLGFLVLGSLSCDVSYWFLNMRFIGPVLVPVVTFSLQGYLVEGGCIECGHCNHFIVAQVSHRWLVKPMLWHLCALVVSMELFVSHKGMLLLNICMWCMPPFLPGFKKSKLSAPNPIALLKIILCTLLIYNSLIMAFFFLLISRQAISVIPPIGLHWMKWLRWAFYFFPLQLTCWYFTM